MRRCRSRRRLARERLAALEHSLAEREGLPPAARALAEEGERLALSLLEVDAGYERAVAAALARRAAALVASDAGAALGLVERARKAGLGDLAVLVPPRGEQRPTRPPLVGAEPLSSHVRALPGGERVAALLADVWLAEPSDLERAETGVLVTREGHCFDAERGELWFSGETAEAVLLQLDARRRGLAAEAERARAPRRGAARRGSARRRPARWSRWRSASRPCCSEAATRGRALRGAAAGSRRRGCHPRRRAGRGAAPARRRGGRGPASGGRGGRARRRDRRRARAPRGRGGRGETAARGGRSRACGGRRPRRARRADRAARAPPRDAGPGQPAGQGGVRPREGAADRAGRPARRPRSEPQRAGAAARRSWPRRSSAASTRPSRRSARTSPRSPHALPGRRGPPAADRARGGGGARRRGRAAGRAASA